MRAKVIAVTGGKGGIGKSTLALNTAISLKHSDNRVLLIDADFGLANIDVMLGLKPKNNIETVLQDPHQFANAIMEGPRQIHILPASRGQQNMVNLDLQNIQNLIQIISSFAKSYDYIVLDTAAGLQVAVLELCNASDEIIVVVCNEPSSITDAYALIKLMAQVYQQRYFRIVINKVRSKEESDEVFAKLCRVSDQFLDVQLNFSAAIPEDEQVREAMRQRRAISSLYPHAGASIALAKLAQEIKRWPRARPLRGGCQFFLAESIQDGRL